MAQCGPLLVMWKILEQNLKKRKKKKRGWNMTLFTSVSQLSETTRRRCSSMYNIWNWMYTFPYQWIWTMSILIFITGIEMIIKHLGCSFNLHTYVQKKKKKTFRKTTTCTLSHLSTFFFFLTIMSFPFWMHMEQRHQRWQHALKGVWMF